MSRHTERSLGCAQCREPIATTVRAYGVYMLAPDEYNVVRDLDDVSEQVLVHAGSCTDEYTAERIRRAEAYSDAAHGGDYDLDCAGVDA